MKDILIRTAALLLSGAVLVGSAACGDKSTTEPKGAHGHEDEGNLAAANVSGSYDEEDLPYGATMTQLLPSLNEGLPISIEYDGRFLDEEAGRVVSTYLSALTAADEALMETAFYPPYLEYSYQYNGYTNAQDYLDAVKINLLGAISEHVGKDVDSIDIDYIMITDCYGEGSDKVGTDFTDMDKIMNDALGEDFLVKVESGSRKEIYVDFTYKIPDDDTSYDYNYGTGYPLRMFMYKIDGKYYIV
ncbi:MAG: hypothetical protein IJ071_07675 [Ruminococcus sp.]|nr:hypothetical protein [Ruminococcus sp.]